MRAGVYISGKNGTSARFRWVKAPTHDELTQLTHSIAQRTAHYLERQGLLERLCHYIARPAVSTKRLSLTRNGQVRYELKTPWRNGTTHVIFEPLDFMYRMYGMPRAQGYARAGIARLVALVPRPRVNLTRFHGAGESDRTSYAQRKQ